MSRGPDLKIYEWEYIFKRLTPVHLPVVREGSKMAECSGCSHFVRTAVVLFVVIIVLSHCVVKELLANTCSMVSGQDASHLATSALHDIFLT